ncbi:hypothetical protein Poli38472_012515 [Pythium oligandrum]|uniref:phospholipase D n=1 Tax=Pythium oligandrum TaxID=41045 RepID=A0A8K1CE10_PYTOL|nr:hypothetical protein Poli38472_012515 [Pythium oligandrum]|eukprot:TMW61324.1 hypothetical protein Poli38472_012515 [Pythium oligandrum]
MLRPSTLRWLTAVCALVLWTDRVAGDPFDVACGAQSFVDMLVTLCICSPCAFCHFDILTLKCVASENPESLPLPEQPYSPDPVSLGDPFQQPSLRPVDWFLNDSEITASRGGIARTDLSTWSAGNHVDLFSSTDKFFASVVRDVEALPGNNSQLLFTGWEIDDIPFLPQDDKFWSTSRFKQLFGRAMDRGIQARALVWTNLFSRSINSALQKWMNAHQSGVWIFDNRLPYKSSSHHQKTIALLPSNNRPAVAYVGGIDLTSERWDTHYHNESILRRRRGITRSYDGWIDASTRVSGPVAYDVAANFAARWNSKQTPLRREGQILEFTNPPETSVPPITIPMRDNSIYQAQNGAGTASVQLVRTYSCKVGYDFAPRGELSILEGRLKAIRQAKNFIYVEDQYFILVPELLYALLEQLPQIQALVVVAQKPPLSTQVVGYQKLLYDMLHPLQMRFPEKVFVYAPRPSLALYVHTKVVLVDDVFLSVGSSNWNRRSMTSDSEVGVHIIDKNVKHSPDGIQIAGLARQFRLEKFSEFSGLSVEELDKMSFLDALSALDASTSDPTGPGIVAGLSVANDLYFHVYPSNIQDEVDAADHCPDPDH